MAHFIEVGYSNLEVREYQQHAFYVSIVHLFFKEALEVKSY